MIEPEFSVFLNLMAPMCAWVLIDIHLFGFSVCLGDWKDRKW